MTDRHLVFALAAAAAFPDPAGAQSPAPSPVGAPDFVTVMVTNPSPFDRAETVEIPVARLAPKFTAKDLTSLVVREARSRGVYASQAVDTDGDHDPDTLIFRIEMPAGGLFGLSISKGPAPRKPKREEYRVYGRFVRERFDDFAWENDRVAFRMYGAALETWEREPLTSSAVDAWSKKTRRLVINDWYQVDDYHKDHGEGGDFYSAGRSRGCGGSGLFANGQLFTSKNFRATRVLANGPIRVMFELTYDAFDVAGAPVKETKRISLDAGENLSRFESRYSAAAGAVAHWAAGLKKEKGAATRLDKTNGVIRTWEALLRYGDNGFLGCGVVADPSGVVDTLDLDPNVLLVSKGSPVYYAGSGWDRGDGVSKDVASWDAYLDRFAQRLKTPLQIEIK